MTYKLEFIDGRVIEIVDAVKFSKVGGFLIFKDAKGDEVCGVKCEELLYALKK